MTLKNKLDLAFLVLDLVCVPLAILLKNPALAAFLAFCAGIHFNELAGCFLGEEDPEEDEADWWKHGRKPF